MANPSEAEQRYLAIAKELGWKEGGSEQQLSGIAEDSEQASSNGKSAPEGLGNYVSTVAFEGGEQREAGSLHELALSGKVDTLEAYLRAHPGVDLDAKDEYVRVGYSVIVRQPNDIFIIQGYTLLHLASDRGHARVVQLLLERGVNPDIKVGFESCAS